MKIRKSLFSVPLLFAIASVALFTLGFLAGIRLAMPLAFNSADLYIHDTYYVIGHFHPVVKPGAVCAAFAAIYYWLPKLTGRALNQPLGYAHFWCSLVFLLGAFLPAYLFVAPGVHRRSYMAERPSTLFILPLQDLNAIMSIIALLWSAAQLLFLFNLFRSFSKGGKSAP